MELTLYLEKGDVLSAFATAGLFANTNSCNVNSNSTNLPDNVSDATSVVLHDYPGCTLQGEVKLYQVVGGGHTWPDGWQYVSSLLIGRTTRDISANALMWDFFKRQGLTSLVGDLSSDCFVNSIDWSIMNSEWFASGSIADINRDGIVNTVDFSLMNQNWFDDCSA